MYNSPGDAHIVPGCPFPSIRLRGGTEINLFLSDLPIPQLFSADKFYEAFYAVHKSSTTILWVDEDVGFIYHLSVTNCDIGFVWQIAKQYTESI